MTRHAAHSTQHTEPWPFGLLSAVCGLLLAAGPPVWADVQTFFEECPARSRIRLHDESHPWDAHGVLYTAAGLAEVEILRIADWLVDLPLPGTRLRPFQRSVRGIRRGYHRLPRVRPLVRFGEFVDALQLPELSLGDASALHSVATGGTAGPGSGMIVRLHKLIDWTQHLTADLNALLGWPVRRAQGLVRWSGPGRAVDALQRGLLATFNGVQVFASRLAEGAMTGLELGAEGVVNVGHRRPHVETTVFVRLPADVYRRHETWVLEHQDQVVIGPPELFAESTHAVLWHSRKARRRKHWATVDHWLTSQGEIVLMTTTRVAARAPAGVRSSIVPAAWILERDAREPFDNR